MAKRQQEGSGYGAGEKDNEPSLSTAWYLVWLFLNLHFHMLFLDGVYVEDGHGKLRFHRVKAPNVDELKSLVHAISHRVARFLEKRGFLERDAENSYLALEPDDDDAMVQLQGHSITYRIAVGPQQGKKVFTLQTLPPDEDTQAAQTEWLRKRVSRCTPEYRPRRTSATS